jgi:hypothetical protein
MKEFKDTLLLIEHMDREGKIECLPADFRNLVGERIILKEGSENSLGNLWIAQ